MSHNNAKQNNPKKTFLYFKIFSIILIIVLIISISFGCKLKEKFLKIFNLKSSQTTQETSGQTSLQTDSQQNVSKNDSENQGGSSTSTSITETNENKNKEKVKIPEDIKKLIIEADKYYNDGEYSLAKVTYRKAEIAIKSSNLDENTKKELIDSFYKKYLNSRDIVDSSRIHYANAMQLQYETNYKQALEELEKALKIYPKYKEAQEAYENLKVLMGLSK